jgi:hypothetical protein
MKALSREEKRRELHELPDENGDASPKDASPKVMLFRDFYRCAECGCEWSDVWSAQCDERLQREQ